MKAIKLLGPIILLSGVMAMETFTSCERETHIYLPDEGRGDTNIINIDITNNVHGDSINWNNDILSYNVVPSGPNVYCPHGGWIIEIYQNNVHIQDLPGPCNGSTDTIVLNSTDTIVLNTITTSIDTIVNIIHNSDTISRIDTILSEFPDIRIHSEFISLDSLCNIRKWFSEIGNEISLIGMDTICQGPKGDPGETDTVVIINDTTIYDTTIIVKEESCFFEEILKIRDSCWINLDSPMEIKNLKFFLGSKKIWNIKIHLKYEDGSKSTFLRGVEGNSDFDFQTLTSYNSLLNIAIQKTRIIAIGFKVDLAEGKTKERNDYVHLRKICARL